MNIVIGSRGSNLALWQASWVKDQLTAAGHEVTLKIIKTTGDALQNFAPQQPLPLSTAQAVAAAGTKGLFIKEIEEALLAGEIDLAVHSLKDMPTVQPEGLILAAVPPREDARDVFISRTGRPFAELPQAARVGTSSPRRQAQLRNMRQDLDFPALRGNLDTRLRKLERGDCEALVLAAAGLHRLGLHEAITGYFALDELCPAAGQGALGIEMMDSNHLREAVASLDDPASHSAVLAERALLRRLGGGCQVPIAAHARFENGSLVLRGMVARMDGSRLIRAAAGAGRDPEGLGQEVADALLSQGARAILESV